MKDLIEARVKAGGRIVWDADDVRPIAFDSERPHISFREGGGDDTLECDFIAGCDGFHGICRPSVPDGALQFYEHTYPFAWLGILAEAPPASEELIYSNHERGFALLSMRSPKITRLYLQCRPDEDLAEWSNDRIWGELHTRLASNGDFRLKEGRILQKSVTPMRSFVTEPMQYGRLFLAGDAAHIVPPTGAKGMNLAVADVYVLSRALSDFYKSGSKVGLQRYSANCLQRVWRADGQEVVNLPDAAGKRRRSDQPADPPTRHRVRLAGAADRDRALAHAREHRDADVLPRVHEVLVDLVSDRDRVMLDAERRDDLELGPGVNLSSGVVRRVDDDRSRP